MKKKKTCSKTKRLAIKIHMYRQKSFQFYQRLVRNNEFESDQFELGFSICASILYLNVEDVLVVRTQTTASIPNQNCLSQLCEIPWNQATDVHSGSTLIMRVIT